MALQVDNWFLNAYTNNTWTDLVAEAAIIKSLVISNPTATAVTVEIQVVDGGVSPPAALAQLLAPAVVDENESFTLDGTFALTGSQVLQVRCDYAGVEFSAFGMIDAA